MGWAPSTPGRGEAAARCEEGEELGWGLGAAAGWLVGWALGWGLSSASPPWGRRVSKLGSSCVNGVYRPGGVLVG